jgi:biotin carboxylase
MSAIWMVGGGSETLPGIRRAQELGLFVVVSDGDPKAPGLRIADHAVVASTYDVEATLESARRFQATRGGLRGVLCLGTDVPVTVARVAEALGLPGISPESARLATDKLAMKEKLAADGVPVPWFRPLRDARELARLLRQEGPPLVIKPVDSRGARGVLQIGAGSDLEWAFETSRGYSPTGRVMVERFLAGPQLSTESLVLDGVAHTVGIADRNYENLARFAPYVIEDGGEMPSAIPDALRARVGELVARAAASLGVRTGVVKGDLVVSGGEPAVIELAARPSGGCFCTHLIPLSTGVDFVEQAIRVALGETPPAAALAPTRSRGAAIRFLFPEPGVVTKIRGVPELIDRPDLAFFELRVGQGDVVPPLESHVGRAGLVITTGETREEAVRSAREAAAGLTLETRPLPVAARSARRR